MARYRKGSSGQSSKCPYCGSLDTVIEKWVTERGTGRKRGERKCWKCKKKFNTYPKM